METDGYIACCNVLVILSWMWRVLWYPVDCNAQSRISSPDYLVMVQLARFAFADELAEFLD
jgi:hypothetical protein